MTEFPPVQVPKHGEHGRAVTALKAGVACRNCDAHTPLVATGGVASCRTCDHLADMTDPAHAPGPRCRCPQPLINGHAGDCDDKGVAA